MLGPQRGSHPLLVFEGRLEDSLTSFWSASADGPPSGRPADPSAFSSEQPVGSVLSPESGAVGLRGKALQAVFGLAGSKLGLAQTDQASLCRLPPPQPQPGLLPYEA